MWTTAEPVVREWIERNLGRSAGLKAPPRRAGSGPLPGEVPGLLSRSAELVEQLDAITRDGLVLAPRDGCGDRARGGAPYRWTAAALWSSRSCWPGC